LLLAVVGAWAQEARPVVALRATATVHAPEVLLGQVCEITAAGALREKLATVSLGSGPVPGTQRIIEAGYVRLRLRRFGIDPAEVELRGTQVVVSAPAAQRRAQADECAAPDAAVALVRRGQLVEVRVQCGAVTIHATGRALADASELELVKVSLEGSSRTITVRVTGPAEAECIIAGSDT
jgi:hypothetical protein